MCDVELMMLVRAIIDADDPVVIPHW